VFLEKLVILSNIVILNKIVILSEAKDLLSSQRTRQQVLRFAQDDNSYKPLAFLAAADRLRVTVEHCEQRIA
jgi:hypothetical protein